MIKTPTYFSFRIYYYFKDLIENAYGNIQDCLSPKHESNGNEKEKHTKQ